MSRQSAARAPRRRLVDRGDGRLQRLAQRIVHGPALRVRLADAGFEPIGSTPDEAQRNLRRELEVIPRLVRQIGLAPP